jgi:ketopantoate reductase
MRILFYGAGPLGSLMAARLVEVGHDVVVLARGQRLADLRQHGIVLENDQTGEREVTRVDVIEELAPDDTYDLIMVVMRKNQALQILPDLAANKTQTVLFMMNNVTGFDDLVVELGRERVMVGFPLAGGIREGHVMRVIPADEQPVWEIPVGEVDGRITARTRRIAAILEGMRGYKVQIRTDMDAWLKYHAAVVVPLSGSLYAADIDRERVDRTPDALVLGIRAMKEAVRGLRLAGVPPSPSVMRAIEWLPEPLLITLVHKLATAKRFEVSVYGHPQAARDEMGFLMDELMELLKSSGIETPYLDQLAPYFDPAAPPMREGSDEIPVDWGGVVLPGVTLLGLVALVAGVWMLRRHK